MSEKPRPSPEPHPLYAEEWQRFGQELEAAAGFKETAPAHGGTRAWTGSVSYEWQDGDVPRKDTAEILIELPAGFPFQKPFVYPTGATAVANARHQAPASMAGWLCIWPEGNSGWRPGAAATELLERVRSWFRCYRSDRWAEQDRPPDLHLYYPTLSQDRQMVVIGEDWKFPADQQTGRFRLWSTRPGVRLIATRLDTPDKLPALRVLAPTAELESGIWFLLRHEPAPRLQLDQLLAEIDAAAGKPAGWALQQVKGTLGEKIRDQKAECVLALGYPRTDGGNAWLFLKAEVGAAAKNGNGKWARAESLRTIPLRSCETAAADRSTMTRRIEHVAEGLRGQHAVIFGIGAIGSTVAILLAKAGVERLTLVDDETLRPGNCVRHECGLEFAGAPKTRAMQLNISYHAPHCDVKVAKTTWNPEELKALVAGASVVVDATAMTSFSLLLNEICLRTSVPAVYATGHRRAAVGRIRAVRPTQDDACLVCYEGEGGLVDRDGAYPVIPSGAEGDFVETGCGSPTVQASAVDIEAIANQVARTAVWILLGRLKAGNHCLVVNEILPDGAGPLATRGIHWSSWRRTDACQACALRKGNVQEEQTPAVAAS